MSLSTEDSCPLHSRLSRDALGRDTQHRSRFDARYRASSSSLDGAGETGRDPLCSRHGRCMPSSRLLSEGGVGGAAREAEINNLRRRIVSLEAHERSLLSDLQKKEALVHASMEAARGSGDGLKCLLRELRDLQQQCAEQTAEIAGLKGEVAACKRKNEGLEISQRQKELHGDSAQLATLKSQLAAARLAAQEAEHQKQRLRQRIGEMETDVIKYKTREAQQHEETVNELVKKLRAAKVRLAQLKTEKAEAETQQQRLRQAAAARAQETETARIQLETKETETETLKADCHRLKQQLQTEQAARESHQMECQRLTQALESLQQEAAETQRCLSVSAAQASADWASRLKALQQETQRQHEETVKNAAEERRRALDALREELRCVHSQEIELMRSRLCQREEETEKLRRQCKALTVKLEETAAHGERLRASGRRDRMHLGELEGRIETLREEHGSLQQQHLLLQQQLQQQQQEAACLSKQLEAAQHAQRQQQQQLQQAETALQTTEAYVKGLETEKETLNTSFTQIKAELAKVTEESVLYRGRLVDLWRCVSSVCPAGKTLEGLAGSCCPALLWTLPLRDLQRCVETAVETVARERERNEKERADEQIRILEDAKLAVEARLASREEELQASRSLTRCLEVKAADAQKQVAMACEERAELQQQLQQQLQQVRRQHERDLLETKSLAAAERQQMEATLRDDYSARAERQKRQGEMETRRLRQQVKEVEDKAAADCECMRAQLAASQQEAAALRNEVQQLCGEIEGLQSERLRLHEAIASVESDGKAMHGIFRRHMETECFSPEGTAARDLRLTKPLSPCCPLKKETDI